MSEVTALESRSWNPCACGSGGEHVQASGGCECGRRKKLPAWATGTHPPGSAVHYAAAESPGRSGELAAKGDSFRELPPAGSLAVPLERKNTGRF